MKWMLLLLSLNVMAQVPAKIQLPNLDSVPQSLKSTTRSEIKTDSLVGVVDSLKMPMDTVKPTKLDSSPKKKNILKVALSWLPKDTNWSVPVLTTQELTGRFDYKKSKSFVKLPNDLTDGQKSYFLRTPAARALEKMILAAKKAGISLKVVSSTRNFSEQKAIWEKKWMGGYVSGTDYSAFSEPWQKISAILQYSSMPSTSRHHWGTDVDINSVDPKYFTKSTGKKVYQWLSQNAAKYGYCQVYNGKNQGRTGYDDESWHWSFLPLAKPILSQYIKKSANQKMISGFQGAEYVDEKQMIQNYVLGIASSCK